MANVVLWERDVSEQMRKAYKSKALPNLKGYSVELSLGGKLLKAFEKEKDHVTPQQMVEDAQELCDEVVADLNKDLKKLDTDLDGAEEEEIEKRCDAFEKEMAKQVKELGKKVAKVPEIRWQKFVDAKEQYKDYKIESGFKVTIGTLGAIGSGLAIAAAVPTGGASLALGIVGGIRSGLGLAKLLHGLWQDLEDVQASAEKNLDILAERYKSKGKLVANETGGNLINTIFGAEFASTVGKVENDVKLWSNKLAGVTVNGHKLGAEAIGVLKDIDKLEKMLKSKKSRSIKAKIEKLQPQLEKLLSKAEEMNGRVGPSEKCLDAAEQLVKELNQKVPDLQKAFNTLLPIVTSLALAGANAGVGFKEAADALDYANTALGLANDLLSTVNDAVA